MGNQNTSVRRLDAGTAEAPPEPVALPVGDTTVAVDASAVALRCARSGH